MPNAGPPGTPQQPPPKRPTGASPPAGAPGSEGALEQPRVQPPARAQSTTGPAPPAGAPGSEGAPQQPKVQPPAGAPSVTGSAVPPTPHGSSHWVDITLFDGLAEAIDTNLNA